VPCPEPAPPGSRVAGLLEEFALRRRQQSLARVYETGGKLQQFAAGGVPVLPHEQQVVPGSQRDHEHDRAVGPVLVGEPLAAVMHILRNDVEELRPQEGAAAEDAGLQRPSPEAAGAAVPGPESGNFVAGAVAPATAAAS